MQHTLGWAGEEQRDREASDGTRSLDAGGMDIGDVL